MDNEAEGGAEQKVQGWMIWAPEDCQWYEATPEGFRAVNGRYTYNRPLHIGHGPMKALAGDRPQVKLAQTPDWHYGDLSFAVQQGSCLKWCHEWERIEAVFNPGFVRWRLKDPAFPEVELTIEALPLAEADGIIVRLLASRPARVLWLLSGLKHDPWSILGQGPMPGGLGPHSVRDCRISLQGYCIAASHPQCPKTAWAASAPRGIFRFTDGLHLPHLSQPIDIEVKSSRVPYGVLDLGNAPAYIVLIAAHEGGRERLEAMLADAEGTYDAALGRCRQVQSQAATETPELTLDQAMKGVCVTLDGCWYPPSYLHGAVRWGVECKGWFLGWRGWYGPTCLGWYDRVRTAIRFHAQHRVAEGLEGYMSRGKLEDWVGFDGSHGGWVEGNMGEVYLDHIYHYYCWTGDRELLREMWPVIKEAIEWERRTLDPDGDNLFENHINTWISDGHWYAGGAGAQASAYMYRAYLLAAEAASLVGEDPAPYLALAEATRRAMNERLWLPQEGHYAEYQEFLPPKRLHSAAELPTIYHPIDSGVTDPFQAYQSLRYVEGRLWFPDDVLLVNDWRPVIVTNGTIAFSEMLHTALCYFLLREVEKGWRLLHACLTPFVKARVPGAISAYGGWDARQGTYPEFTDTASMFARTVVEGLFGIRPQRQRNLICIGPNLPPEWEQASIRLPDIRYSFRREGAADCLEVETAEASRKRLEFIAREDEVEKVTVNGAPVAWQVEPRVGRPIVTVEVPESRHAVVRVHYRPAAHCLRYEAVQVSGEPLALRPEGCNIEAVHDPQGLLLQEPTAGKEGLLLRLRKREGPGTLFVKLSHGNTQSWAPVNLDLRPPWELLRPHWVLGKEGRVSGAFRFALRNNSASARRARLRAELLGQACEAEVALGAHSELVVPMAVTDLSSLSPGGTRLCLRLADGQEEIVLHGELRRWRSLTTKQERERFRALCQPLELPFNARLEELFERDYWDPELPPTALRICRDGLNAWTGTWYSTSYINLDHIREQLGPDGLFWSDVDVPFRQVREGANGLFLSRWPGWKSAVRIPVGRQARKLYLLLAGTTLNNQFEVENGRIALLYADGSEEVVPLVNPDNYDHMLQHFAARNWAQWVGGEREGYYGVGRASGTHADILDIELKETPLQAFRLECLSREITIGLIGATLWG
jgi:hypothetical protein